jgi:hypothetical protein
MGKKLEAATGGRLSIQMYASMQLGGEKEGEEARLIPIGHEKIRGSAVEIPIYEYRVAGEECADTEQHEKGGLRHG